jgi:hypothetical protein
VSQPSYMGLKNTSPSQVVRFFLISVSSLWHLHVVIPRGHERYEIGQDLQDLPVPQRRELRVYKLALLINSFKVAPQQGGRINSLLSINVIGRAKMENLLINAGHGHLGWTMAAVSASLLAEILVGTAQSLDPELYALARFEGGWARCRSVKQAAKLRRDSEPEGNTTDLPLFPVYQ